MLDEVGIADPARRMTQYPFELSGGMCQRVMIAIALICRPRLLIADEPTTALDVTIQAQILALIKRLRRETGTGLLLITHDMGVVADMADRISVMYAGRVVEEGDVFALFRRQHHPYTRLLLKSLPSIDARAARALQHDRGRGAGPALLADGLPLQPALPARRRHLPHRGARCSRRSRRPSARPAGTSIASRSWTPDEPAAAQDHRPEGALSDPPRRVPAADRRREGGRWRQLRDPGGRDLRAGRRKRLRQVDHRLCDARHRHGDRRAGRFSRRRPDAARSRGACATRNATCRSSSRIRIPRSIRR